MNEPSEMPTPRTDALLRERKEIPNRNELWDADDVSAFLRHSRQLERDLSTLRKAAEAARVALEFYAETINYVGGVDTLGFYDSSEWKHYPSPIQDDDGAIAQQALASLRSELAKTTPATPETPAPHPG